MKPDQLKPAPGWSATPALCEAHQIAVCYLDAVVGQWPSVGIWRIQLRHSHAALYDTHPAAILTRPLFDAYQHAGLSVPGSSHHSSG